MRTWSRFMVDEARRTLSRPQRLRRLLRPGAVRHVRSIRRSYAPALAPSGDVARRQYRSYDDYVRHQVSKVARLDLTEHHDELRRVLGARLASWDDDVAGRAVLCLGARSGAEVLAFRDLGAFAIGVDLEPGPRNGYVVHGDFHELDFADDCVDLVYTNSLDHALDLERVVREVRRVLRPSGLAIIEVGLGTAEGGGAGDWEAIEWSSSEVVAKHFTNRGFRLETSTSFDRPWAGVAYRLRPSA